MISRLSQQELQYQREEKPIDTEEDESLGLQTLFADEEVQPSSPENIVQSMPLLGDEQIMTRLFEMIIY